MPATFADVILPRTAEQVYQSITAGIDADLMAAGQPAITAGWLPGNVLRTMARVVSVGISACDQVAALLGSGASFSTATAAVLTARCSGYEQVDRIEASAAVGFVSVSNVSGAPVTIIAGIETFKNPANGNVYTATSGAIIASGAVAIIGVSGPVLGTGADAAPNTITQLVRVRPGVACNNTGAVLGVDRESDPSLIARARLSPIARQPAATYAKFFTAASNVTGHGVAVNRVSVVRVVDGAAAGTVAITCARASGVLLAGEATTILNFVIANALGDSGSVSVSSAVAVATAPASLILWAADTDARTDSQIIQAVLAAISTEFANIPIGGYLFGAQRIYPTDRISTLIQNLGLVQSDGVPPDVGMLSNQVIVPGPISATVQRVRK